MRAYNRRLQQTCEVVAIDFSTNKVKLINPSSSPKFIFEEKIANINIMEDVGVVLDGENIYTGDIITDGVSEYVVRKVAGGYYPFFQPVKKNFRKAIK